MFTYYRVLYINVFFIAFGDLCLLFSFAFTGTWYIKKYALPIVYDISIDMVHVYAFLG